MLFQKEWSSKQPAQTEEWVTRSCYQELIGKVGNIQDKPAPLLKIQVTDEGQKGLVKLLLIALLPTELSPQLWEPLLARAVAKAAIGRTAPASLVLGTVSENTARALVRGHCSRNQEVSSPEITSSLWFFFSFVLPCG